MNTSVLLLALAVVVCFDNAKSTSTYLWNGAVGNERKEHEKENTGATLENSPLEVYTKLVKVRDELKKDVSILDEAYQTLIDAENLFVEFENMNVTLNQAIEASKGNGWQIAALVLTAFILLLLAAFCCCLYYLHTGKVPFANLSFSCCDYKALVDVESAGDFEFSHVKNHGGHEMESEEALQIEYKSI